MSDELKKEFLAGLSKLYSRAEVVDASSLVKEKYGLNLWFFKEVPGNTPTKKCTIKNGMPLLFIGSAPGQSNSPRTLYERIYDDHYNGNASTSTLRESLGILLLGERRDLLRRIGTSDKMTFTREGEECLSKWMDKNARVCWYEHPTPWEIKEKVINAFSPPLNIKSGAHKIGEELKFWEDLRDRRKKILRRSRKPF